jgi:hypothetical protein
VPTFRCFLVPLTAAWLSVHLLAVTGAVFAAFSSVPSAAEIVCTCAHGADHGSCPMHGTRTSSPRCRLQGTQDDLANALIPVLGPLMLVASIVATVDTTSAPAPIGDAWALPSGWIVPPEPPPPRS